MATAKLMYDALNTLTITAAALANGTARASLYVDWSSALLLDASLYLEITIASGAPANQKKANVYLYTSMDGANYDDPATGADAAITLTNPSNLTLIGSVEMPTDKAGAASWKKWFPSIAQFFGGYVPLRWGIVIENQTGQAFTACVAKYKGVAAQTL
jgi:hypothetical protein